MKKIGFKEELLRARADHYAIGAFNIFNYVSAKAVIAAAEELQKPVILQTSTGTVKYYGVKEIYAMLQSLINQADVPVYLHLDHCTSAEFAKECIDSGWDAVMIDASRESFEENVRITKEVVDYARQKNVDVEGELGTIEGVEEDIKSDKSELAGYEDCLRYTEQSGVDVFAPAIGTAHGVYQGTPKVDFELCEKLGNDLAQPLVCHGGSGLSEEAFRRLISCGISKINISTALKHAYLDGAKAYLNREKNACTPLDFDQALFQTIKQTAKKHLLMFGYGRQS